MFISAILRLPGGAGKKYVPFSKLSPEERTERNRKGLEAQRKQLAKKKGVSLEEYERGVTERATERRNRTEPKKYYTPSSRLSPQQLKERREKGLEAQRTQLAKKQGVTPEEYERGITERATRRRERAEAKKMGKRNPSS